MEDEIFDIVTDLLRTDISKSDAIDQIVSLSNTISTGYAEFCIRCDRAGLPLLCLEDYIKKIHDA